MTSHRPPKIVNAKPMGKKMSIPNPTIFTQSNVSVDYSVGAPPFRYDWINHPPTVTFGGSETTVQVSNSQVTLTCLRPLVQPWAFTPTGTTYWVATNGNDSNVGTTGSPVRNIQTAINRFGSAGNLIYVRAGTYTEQLTLPDITVGDKLIVSCALANDGGGLGTVTVRLPDQLLTGITTPSVVTLRNFTYLNGIGIQGCMGRPGAPVTSAGTGSNGIQYAGGVAGRQSQVTNCWIYGNINAGIVAQGDYLISKGNIIFANGFRFQDHGYYGNGHDLQTTGNIVFSNAGAGIHYYTGNLAFPVDNAIITQNLSFGNPFAAILLGGNNGTVQKNTGAYNGLYGMDYFNGCKNCACDHNIFAFNGTVQAGFQTGFGGTADLPTCIDDFNGLFAIAPATINQVGGSTPGPTLGAHEVIGDPIFLAALSGDFRSANRLMTAMGCYAP